MFFVIFPSSERNHRRISYIRIIQEDPELIIFNNLWIQVCFRIYGNIIILNVFDIDHRTILFGLETL